MSFKIYVDILFILAKKNFLNRKCVLFNKEFYEKINNVNIEICDSILLECYKNSCKRNSSRQLVKTKYFFDNIENTFQL